jgi:putative ABC transport system ATP-binding protein
VIVARDLAYAYPRGGFRLRVSALDLAAGERLAVVGPSGSGKSTLLDLIAGVRVPDAGSLTVDGVDVPALSEAGRRAFRAARIGFVFQTFELVDYLTVRENILYPLMISAALRLDAAARARAATLAEAAGVADKLGRRPGDLSQGERQRVAICRALIARPRLILADEATGNLDPANKGVVMDLLFAQAAEAGAAVLAVTHDHDLLPRFDRVVDFAAFAESAPA